MATLEEHLPAVTEEGGEESWNAHGPDEHVDVGGSLDLAVHAIIRIFARAARAAHPVVAVQKVPASLNPAPRQ